MMILQTIGLITLFYLQNTVSRYSRYRLPKNVIPKHYVLEIVTNLGHFSFTGNVWILISCEKPTDTIYLHSRNLKITADKVFVKPVLRISLLQNVQEFPGNNKNENIIIKKQTTDIENDFFIIKLNQELKQNENYVIYLPFKGELSKGLEGYYRSHYQDRTTNTTRWLAITQFEPADARQAFPCFDEPEMKAKFTISLGHQSHLKSASNMPLQKTEPMENKPGWVWDRFQDSVPMSTYLVAFMVSDFEYRTSKNTKNKVTFKVWARKDAISQVEFALKVGPQFLSYFEEYFYEKYPLPKQDMVAIPDFSSGAMENWGLITYRETTLLYDENSSSAQNQYFIASVIAHELAHQWFGNLVTMKWWTDLWLNEGFATYVGEIGVHYVHPEWNTLAWSNVENLLSVFSLDALASSHPVSVPIGHPSEISQIFDRISYEKGAYLLHMMNLFLGENVFRHGVSNYLKKNKYLNAEQDDLWSALTSKAHEVGTLPFNISVKEIMNTWTLQTGYPVVTVTRNYNKKTATLKQNRYLTIKRRHNEGCWWVPITFTTQKEMNFDKTMPKQWLNCEQKETRVQIHANPDEWVIFNLQSSGLYRVNYDEKNWHLIASTLNSNYKHINVMNRVQLLADSLAFARGGDISYELLFNLLSYLRNEDEYLPWNSAINNLYDIRKMIIRTPKYGIFKKYVQFLLSKIFNKIGNMKQVPKTYLGIKHQNLIVSWACHHNVGNCVQQAKSLFDEWLNKKDPEKDNPIPKDLQRLVYCLGIKNGDEDVWEYMWQRYKKSNVGSEKSLILSSLACSRNVWILNRYLEWILDNESEIRSQDSARVFSSIARSDIGFYLAKQFFYRNFKKMYNLYGPYSTRIGAYISVLGNQMIYKEDLHELTVFGKNNHELLKNVQMVYNQTLETVDANVRWYNTYYKKFMQIISDQLHAHASMIN